MPASLPFLDRQDAGRQLAEALAAYAGARPLVLAIPRGGVPMGRQVADALGGDLDVVLVRKLGAPGNPELAIGAIDEGGQVMIDRVAADWTGADHAYVARESARQLDLLRERRQLYCGGRSAPPVAGRVVIVVDDGLATGATMISALKAIRAHAPALLVCAVPVGAADSIAHVARFADEMLCLAKPEPFGGVGLHYQQFPPVTDAEVSAALAASQPAPAAARARSVRIEAGAATLDGDLVLPAGARALVVSAHGSGSSRFSERNRSVATALNRRGFGTLLFDLLTPEEDAGQAARFDIGLLARRLEAALDWALADPGVGGLPVVLFGASTGAAAALRVAAERPGDVAAVVSRGGRPDLAGVDALARVQAPTLLLVGGADSDVLDLNRAAAAVLRCPVYIVVIPGATHLFEEPGALDEVAGRSGDWLLGMLSRGVDGRMRA